MLRLAWSVIFSRSLAIAARANNFAEDLDSGNVLVDDRLVDERPSFSSSRLLGDDLREGFLKAFCSSGTAPFGSRGNLVATIRAQNDFNECKPRCLLSSGRGSSCAVQVSSQRPPAYLSAETPRDQLAEI